MEVEDTELGEEDQIRGRVKSRRDNKPADWVKEGGGTVDKGAEDEFKAVVEVRK